MPLGLALHFATETMYTGMSRGFFCLGGERLYFPEFPWPVSYSIVTDHYRGREGKHGYHLLHLILSMY